MSIFRDFFVKEKPVFTGITRGLGGFGFGGGGGASGSTVPTTPSDYPLDTGGYSYYSTVWTGATPNLPVSHTASTFTVPSAAKGYVRVVVVGGSGGSESASGAGDGAYVDALIPVSPGERYKVIVGEAGDNGPSSGTGGNGCGGGCGVDSNDWSSGGGGSAFFYAEPSATSDPAMFPEGVLIAGGGGAGDNTAGSGGAAPATAPDPIGGFDGLFRAGTPTSTSRGEPGQVGGVGGRAIFNDGSSFPIPAAARGSGGGMAYDGINPQYRMGNGGGAGGGGGGGDTDGDSTGGENSPNGRGRGYGAYNTAGAGRGGDFPQRGGNGFTFSGVDLGGGGGGSHAKSAGGGGWGGGGGSAQVPGFGGGAGGSGAWGYVSGTASISAWTPSASISVNGGNVNSVMSVPTTRGQGRNNDGYVVVMW